MIVEPGFLDHWKTRRLVELTGDKTAPLLVLRLWAHCHKAKMWRFRNLTNEKLAGICEWKGDPSELHTTLTKAGFLNIQGPFLVVHEWEKYNRKLVSCWRNGQKGGRYCKTQQEPNANPIEPTLTHGNPYNLIISGTKSTSTESTEEKRRRARPTNREEVTAFAQTQGLTEIDGNWCFDKWEGNGFTNDGKPIKDWRATIRQWKAQRNIFPSHKNGPAKATVSGDLQRKLQDLKSRQKEFTYSEVQHDEKKRAAYAALTKQVQEIERQL